METGSYFDKALSLTNGELVETMRYALSGVKYDTIVGTGLSGTIFAARVAPGLRKKFAIVRKPDDNSTHSGSRIEGHIGKRFVFADDFVSGGTTMKRVLKMMKEHYPDCQFVGVYQYEYDRFMDGNEAAEKWGNWVADLALGGPILGPMTREQMAAKWPFSTLERTAPDGGWHPKFAHIIPLPPMASLELDTMTYDGLPSFWDMQNGQRILATDPRVKDLITLLKPITNPSTYRRFQGMRMDRVLREVPTAENMGRNLAPSLREFRAIGA